MAGTFSLPICEMTVEEVLLSQPRTRIAACELAALFSPNTDAERLKLTKAISRVADIVILPPAAGGGGAGTPFVVLRSGSGGEQHAQSHGPPLPAEPIAVRALLLAQPTQEMPVAELKRRFGDERQLDEAARVRLVEAIAEVGELVASPAGPIVRLKHKGPCVPGAEGFAPASASRLSTATGSSRSSSSMYSSSQPVTPTERDLVRKVLSKSPGGCMKPEELVKMLAPTDPAAKRRLALVLSEVAQVTERPDGCGGTSSVLVLRDATNRKGGSASQSGSALGGHGASLGASAFTAAGSQSRVAGASRMSSASASSRPQPHHRHAPHPPTAAPPHAECCTVVTPELVTALLRDAGGRMTSHALIAALHPLDAAGKRALGAAVQRLCRTLLPSDTVDKTAGGGGAAGGAATVIVLRETLIAERVEARAATTIQRASRHRHAWHRALHLAAVAIQTAARRHSTRRDADALRGAHRAALVIQGVARRNSYVRALRHARAELKSAVVVQMAARRDGFAPARWERRWDREHAAMSVQSAWRRRLAQRVLARLRRAAVMATETEVERCARRRGSVAAAAEKLLRRRRQASKQPPTTTMTTRERASPPPPQAVCRRERWRSHRSMWHPDILPPTLAVHLADADADEAMGAPSTTGPPRAVRTFWRRCGIWCQSSVGTTRTTSTMSVEGWSTADLEKLCGSRRGSERLEARADPCRARDAKQNELPSARASEAGILSSIYLSIFFLCNLSELIYKTRAPTRRKRHGTPVTVWRLWRPPGTRT